MYKSLLVGGVVFGLSACTPKVAVVPDVQEPIMLAQACEDKPPIIIEKPVPVPMPCQLQPEPVDILPKRKTKGTQRVSARVAAQADTPGGINSVQEYVYMKDALYHVYVGVTTASTILLQPGEFFHQAVVGDKGKWTTSEITAGSAQGDRGGVVINCNEAGARSNLTIAGSRRVYLIELRCTEKTYHAQVSWAYPESGVGILKGSAPAPKTVEPEPLKPVTADAPSGTQYTITSNRQVAWLPTHVYDTGEQGRQTYIVFPPALGVSDAPVLYVRTVEGSQAVANYRVLQGFYLGDRVYNAQELNGKLGNLGAPITYYQVDQIADTLELRSGEKKPTVVKIQRQGQGV